MAVKLYPFDPAEYLDSELAIETFENSAFETGDAAYIAKASTVVERAKIIMNNKLTKEINNVKCYMGDTSMLRESMKN